jgi:predicted dehydrogenase
MTREERRKPLSFAMIGCGRISQVHLSVLAGEPRAKLVAVVDKDRQAAKSAGEAWGAPDFQDVHEMLRKAAPDAVVICAPPNVHRELTEAALFAGAHVLCEKPLALSVAEAEEVLLAAEKADRVLMMCSKFRYVEDVIKAKGVIDSGILGQIVLLENQFCSRVDMKNRWNSKRAVAGGGVLIDNGSHSADIVRYLLGPVTAALAIPGRQWQALEVEDTCTMFLRCARNAMASVDLSWSIQKEHPYYIHVYGTEGTLEVGWSGSRYRQSERLHWVPFGNGYDKLQATGSQLRNFIGTITGEAQPLITAEDALESVRVVESAYRSTQEGRWETVEPAALPALAAAASIPLR